MLKFLKQVQYGLIKAPGTGTFTLVPNSFDQLIGEEVRSGFR
jgi:hypothetical protein